MIEILLKIMTAVLLFNNFRLLRSILKKGSDQIPTFHYFPLVLFCFFYMIHGLEIKDNYTIFSNMFFFLIYLVIFNVMMWQRLDKKIK
jgi:hypothetical protein